MQFSDSKVISKISKIHTKCSDFLKEELLKKGLPNLASSHGHILYLLSKENQLSMQEIANKINRDKSTTTVLIKKLQKLNLVSSNISQKDSRQKFIELSEAGRLYTEQTQQIADNLKQRFFKNLNDSEIEMLENLLDKVSSNF